MTCSLKLCSLRYNLKTTEVFNKSKHFFIVKFPANNLFPGAFFVCLFFEFPASRIRAKHHLFFIAVSAAHIFISRRTGNVENIHAIKNHLPL
jgi:hypothetical protein